MEIQRIQNDTSGPSGQRGADIIRRPPSAPAPQPQQRETALPRSYQADQGYGYDQAPATARPVDPRAFDPRQAKPEAQQAEPAPAPSPEPDQSQRPDEWAQRYAQIQKRERQVFQRDQEIKRREQALQERESRVRQFEETLALKDKDPKTFLEKNGLSYSQITDVYLNDGKPTPEQQIQQLQSRLDALIQGREEEKKQLEDQTVQEKIKGFQRNIEGVIESTEGERFELIKAQKAHNLVFDVIQNYFQETGEMLQITEAADFVENELYTEAQRLMGLSKFKPKAAPAEIDQPSEESPQRPPEPQRTSRPQSQLPARSQTVVRDAGGINNLSYAQQSKREAARMLRFHR